MSSSGSWYGSLRLNPRSRLPKAGLREALELARKLLQSSLLELPLSFLLTNNIASALSLAPFQRVNSLVDLVVRREPIPCFPNRLLSATMVELRKRKTPPPAPVPAPKKERKTKAAKANGKSEPVAEPAAPEPSAAPVAAPEPETKAASGTPKPGDMIDLEGFGGEVETNDGRKVTLKSLVDESKEGVVLFTYPKASTPGCELLCFRRDTVSSLICSLPEVASC